MIGDQPQPKDPEIITAERICQEMREIAKRLSKPNAVKAEERVEQFGNNFYMLFWDMGQENSKLGLVQRAENLYGDKWKKFLENNADLLAQISEALKPIKTYLELLERYRDLMMNPKTRDLADRIDEEINLDGIGIDAQNKLNPLLKQASEAMAQCGIKSENFFSEKIIK